jgi:hypothetical protein
MAVDCVTRYTSSISSARVLRKSNKNVSISEADLAKFQPDGSVKWILHTKVAHLC